MSQQQPITERMITRSMSRASTQPSRVDDQQEQATEARQATEIPVAPLWSEPEETFRAMPGDFGVQGDTATIQNPTPRRWRSRPTEMEDVTGRQSQDSQAHLAPQPLPGSQEVPLHPEYQRETEEEGISHRLVSQSPPNLNSEEEANEVE